MMINFIVYALQKSEIWGKRKLIYERTCNKLLRPYCLMDLYVLLGFGSLFEIIWVVQSIKVIFLQVWSTQDNGALEEFLEWDRWWWSRLLAIWNKASILFFSIRITMVSSMAQFHLIRKGSSAHFDIPITKQQRFINRCMKPSLISCILKTVYANR